MVRIHSPRLQVSCFPGFVQRTRLASRRRTVLNAIPLSFIARPSKPQRALNGRRFTYCGRKHRRRTEAEAWAEIAQLQGRDDNASGRPPLTIAVLIDRWEAERGSPHANEMLDELAASSGSFRLDDIEPDLLTRYENRLARHRNKKSGSPLEHVAGVVGVGLA